MANTIILNNKPIIKLDYVSLGKLQSLSSSHDIHKSTNVKKLKRNDGNSNLIIENSYYERINDLYHNNTSVNDHTNPSSIKYKKFNNIVDREVQIINELTNFPEKIPHINASDDGVYRISLYHCKIVFYKGILNIRHNKLQKVKESLVCSFNMSNDNNNIYSDNNDNSQIDDEETIKNTKIIFEEISLLNVAQSKSGNSLIIERPIVEIEINPFTKTIKTLIKYHVQYGCSVNQTISPTIMTKIHKVVAPHLKPRPFPASNNEVMDFINEDVSAQLFYNSMSKTAIETEQPGDFELPELETKLLKFQTKTVNWLLNKESVIYNPETNRTQVNPLISNELNDTILNFLESGIIGNNDDLDKEVSIILNRLVFGWERVYFNDLPFWYNRYNVNLIDNISIYQFIANYYRSQILPKSLPGQGLLGEEMGLGKTVEIVSLALLNQRPSNEIDEVIQSQLRQYGDLKPVIKAKTTLIIAPDSILKQWVSEVQKLAPSLAVTIYEGLDKYPKFKNNAKIIANYLKMFDIVFTTYSVLGKELDYALYSSKNNLTRSSKRKARPENLREYSYNDDAGDDKYQEQQDEAEQNNVDETEENNYNEDNEDNEDDYANYEISRQEKQKQLDDYQSYFQLSLRIQKPKNANEKTNFNQKATDYEQALQDEIELVLKHNELSNSRIITKDYQSPIMLLQFWRVVLDEVQMVSSKISRSFQSASLIPRYHSWGVSGTPIKKNIDDLHSVLVFLKINPFIGEIGKNSWEILVKGNNVNDFIRLWSGIGLRHTKAMVHDDIKLPPQHRMLMTIPFNPVEQENYNQLLSDCLASICLDSNGNPVIDDWEPTPSIISEMKQSLIKLRQVCGNPQIGKLSLNLRRYKSRNYYFSRNDFRDHFFGSSKFQNVQALKTLDDVLDDMLNSSISEVINSERIIIGNYLDVAQLYETILNPEEARKSFEFISNLVQIIIGRIKYLLNKASNKYNKLIDDKSNVDNEINKDDNRNQDEDIDDDIIKLDDEDFDESERKKLSKLSEKALKEAQDLNEQIKTFRQRLRQWNITLHKCYFLLASSNFQLYDEEYATKIETLSKPFTSPDINKNFKPELVTELLVTEPLDVPIVDVKSLMSNFQTPDSDDEKEIRTAELKFMEQTYYHLAEEIRSDLLKGSIITVDRVTLTRFKKRESFKTTTFIDDGSSLLPKTTKKVFKSLPIIKTEDFEELIVGIKPKIFMDKIKILIIQLNKQSEIINDWMSQLIEILSSPLLTHDQDPNGEEYEKSIESQDKASCYLHLLGKLMIDRMEVLNGKEAAAKVSNNKRRDQDSIDMEMSGINDKEFLKSLEYTRSSVKPKYQKSFNDLIHESKTVENELKHEINFLASNNGGVSLDLFQKLSNRLSIIYDNQKLSAILFQKELASSCNAVFNARIDYFKQLQQISDSVKTPDFNLDVNDLDTYTINNLFLRFKKSSDYSILKLEKSISRFRYLRTISKMNYKLANKRSDVDSDSTENKQDDEETEDEDALMCIICRSVITIGSLTSCGHKYCKDCLEQWLRTKHSCPLCKTSINSGSVYNFTHYKPNLKANKVIDGPAVQKDKNLFSIYKHIDNEIIDKVQNIVLDKTYSSKVDMIVKQVLYLKSNDPNVQIVIFSQWQDLLYILATAFKSANISYLASYGTLTPEVGAGRRKTRYDSVEQFKNPENGITCFLLNAKAQASGLTLINATHIFLCEPLVNTSLELQAISRIHRIGQTNITTVWMFAIENTVEESITLLSTNKRLQYLEFGTPPPDSEAFNLPNKILDGNSSNSNADEEKHQDKDLSVAESMTLMKSGGIDTLFQKGAGEGESVSNGDLWNAFFCATSSKDQRETMNIDSLSKID